MFNLQREGLSNQFTVSNDCFNIVNAKGGNTLIYNNI